MQRMVCWPLWWSRLEEGERGSHSRASLDWVTSSRHNSWTWCHGRTSQPHRGHWTLGGEVKGERSKVKGQRSHTLVLLKSIPFESLGTRFFPSNMANSTTPGPTRMWRGREEGKEGGREREKEEGREREGEGGRGRKRKGGRGKKRKGGRGVRRKERGKERKGGRGVRRKERGWPHGNHVCILHTTNSLIINWSLKASCLYN